MKELPVFHPALLVVLLEPLVEFLVGNPRGGEPVVQVPEPADDEVERYRVADHRIRLGQVVGPPVPPRKTLTLVHLSLCENHESFPSEKRIQFALRSIGIRFPRSCPEISAPLSSCASRFQASSMVSSAIRSLSLH